MIQSQLLRPDTTYPPLRLRESQGRDAGASRSGWPFPVAPGYRDFLLAREGKTPSCSSCEASSFITWCAESGAFMQQKPPDLGQVRGVHEEQDAAVKPVAEARPLPEEFAREGTNKTPEKTLPEPKADNAPSKEPSRNTRTRHSLKSP